MKNIKRFCAWVLLIVVAFCFECALGITNANYRVSSTNMTRSVTLTQEMFPSLTDLDMLENLIDVKASGKLVPFDQITVPARKTIQLMARRTIPTSGLHDANPIDVLDTVMNPPPLPEDYSIGLYHKPSSLVQRAKENSFDGCLLSCSVTNVSDLIFSVVVTQAFDCRFCVNSMGDVSVRNKDDSEVNRNTVYVLTLGKTLGAAP